MANATAPFHPIIYVRGYAMTEREQDVTMEVIRKQIKIARLITREY